MNKQKAFFVVSAFSCAAVLFGAAGCNNDGGGPEVAATVKTPEQRAQDIQSNPNMPPQAKAAALAAMQQNQAKGQAAGQAAAQTSQTSKK